MSYSHKVAGHVMRGYAARHGLGQGDVPAVGQELGIDPRSRASSNGGRVVPTMWLQRALNASGVPSPLLRVDNNAGSSDTSHTMVAARTYAARNGNRTPLPQRTDDPGHVVISTSMEANLSLLRRVADPTGSAQTGWLTPTERGTTPITTTAPPPTTIAPPIAPPVEPPSGGGMPIWPFALGAVAVAGVGAWFLLVAPTKKVSSNRSRRRHSKRVRRNSSKSTRFKRPPREGTRVQYLPSPASHALYSHPPTIGEHGTVKPVSTGRGKSTFMRGPGGGLVYVDWDHSAFQGVSLHDLARARPLKGTSDDDLSVNARQISPVPGLSSWQTYAGGTTALPGTHGYGYKRPDWVTEYHIWAPTRRGGGYTLAAFAVPGVRAHWSHYGPFKTPHIAAKHARQLGVRYGVQERAA